MMAVVNGRVETVCLLRECFPEIQIQNGRSSLQELLRTL